MLPSRMLAELTARITDIIRVPLSVDFEGGYTRTPAKIAENLKPILDAGAVGINIEDGEGTPELLADAKGFLATGDSEPLFNESLAYGKLQKLFTRSASRNRTTRD